MAKVTELSIVRDKRVYDDVCLVTLSESSWIELYEEYAREPSKLLSRSELTSFSSFKSKRRKQSYLMGRLCAKTACVSLAFNEDDILLSSIEILKGVFEFPVVSHPQLSNIQVSISHVNGFACAIAYSERHPMSIDIECLDEKRCRTMGKKLEEDEIDCQESFCSVNKKRLSNFINTPTDLNSYFNLINWTAKESVSKVLRTGLMCPTRFYEVKACDFLPRESFKDIYDVFGLKEGTFVCVSMFKHFSQYKVISFLDTKLGNVISICLPKKTKLKKFNRPN
ncbi:hypothetical protein HOG98_08190 [bacterium]|nr:hypothetical protein [bacterium]